MEHTTNKMTTATEKTAHISSTTGGSITPSLPLYYFLLFLIIFKTKMNLIFKLGFQVKSKLEPQEQVLISEQVKILV